MKPIVIWMENKDVAKMTKKKLEELIQQAYNQGYNEGYSKGYSDGTKLAYIPAPSYSDPYEVTVTGTHPYNPCTTTVTADANEGK